MRSRHGLPTTTFTVIDRRHFVITAAALACLISTGRDAAAGGVSADTMTDAAPFERTELFREAYDKLVAGATPTEGKVSLELPELAENGNFVPVTITVDSPMTDTDHVRKIHILSTGNPVANVATFHLSPLNGSARVQSRMRLARSQDVVVVAELSTGELTMSTLTVKVALGGCQT